MMRYTLTAHLQVIISLDIHKQTQTEQTPAIANREFHKRLDRNGLNVQRKRMPGADRDANGIRGIVVNWATDHEQLDEIIDQHFDKKDKVLIANE